MGLNQPTAIDGPKDTDSAGCPQTAHVNVGEQ